MSRSLLLSLCLAIPLVASAQAPTLGVVESDFSPFIFDPRGDHEVVITQNASMDITVGGVACASAKGGYTTQNSYYRRFDLSQEALDNDLVINEILVGVGGVTLNGNPLVETLVRLYTLDGDFILANLTPIGEAILVIEEGHATSVVSVEIDNVTVSNDAVLVVEWDTPTGDKQPPFDIRYGANSEGQTGSTYLRAESCGIGEPTATEDVGDFGHLHWVLAVVGTDGAVSNEGEAVTRPVTLGGTYPNPASGVFVLPVELEATGQVRLAVHDLLGREVAVITDGVVTAGSHSFYFDATSLASGTYVLRMTTSDGFSTRRITVAH